MSGTNPLARLFKRSPFKALQEHMGKVLESVRLVPGMLEALTRGDEEGVQAAKEQIFHWEGEADRVKNELRANLPSSLFMAVDRRDLLEILQEQDSIADTAQDIAGLLVERPMKVPEALAEPLLELATHCLATCEHAGTVIGELDELLETGFRGNEATMVSGMIDKLSELEDETDVMGLELTRTLFRHESEIDPVSVILWYRLIEWIGDLADHAEKLGNRLRLLIAR